MSKRWRGKVEEDKESKDRGWTWGKGQSTEGSGVHKVESGWQDGTKAAYTHDSGAER